MTIEAGALYVVATPIGNKGDMTARALETLAAVDIIYAEDTRQTNKLLQHFGIKNTVYQLHQHNEATQKHDIANQLAADKTVALVSDAGTPLIADPGYRVVAHLRALGYRILVVPGCSAVIAGLSIAGLPTEQFQFVGFVPAKPSQRQQFLKTYTYAEQTTVFYEVPHRIRQCLQDCLTIFGEARQLFIGRELTKQFEDSVLLTLGEALAWLDNHAKREKGEFILALAPSDKVAEHDWQQLVRLMASEAIPTKTIAAIVSDYTGEPKKTVYEFALAIKNNA